MCPAWRPSSRPRLSDSIRTKIYTSASGVLDSLIRNVWGSSFRADLGGSNGLEWHGEHTKLQPITHYGCNFAAQQMFDVGLQNTPATCGVRQHRGILTEKLKSYGAATRESVPGVDIASTATCTTMQSTPLNPHASGSGVCTSVHHPGTPDASSLPMAAQHIRPRRHRLSAPEYRQAMQQRFQR